MSSFIMQDIQGQSLSPDLLEQRDYPNRSSQFETLTEIQRELIDSIGNRQLANRLHKRTLKIYKREERLEAIEFYRTHVHVNPQTGEECSLSIATASEALYISECTLKRWIDEERKIISMRQGTRRDDGKRYTTVPTPERLKTGDYSFLRLTPQQLSIRNWIKGKDLYKLHPITHPVPFIGIEGGRRGNIKSFADAYQFLGFTENTSHPGHPQKPDSDSEWQPQKPIIESAALCLENSPENTLESAIPTRIEFDYDAPFAGAPTHWAIKLLLRTGDEFLVPLSLCLRGLVKHEVVPDTLLLRGWTLDYEMLKCKTRKRQRFEARENAIRYSQEFYRKSQNIFQKFRLSPVLFVEDVEMLFQRSELWRPRRFSPAWTLYSTILHSSYRSGDTLTPIYGRYTDIRSLIDSIATKAPLVSFPTNAKMKAFQLVSLSDFSLIPRVPEQAVFSQIYQHLEISAADPHKALSLGLIEETFKQDTHTVREREFREKLMHALKLSAQKNLDYINGEKRCIYYTCPELQAAPSSYYCHHHSRSLIAYVTNSPQPINSSVYQEHEQNVSLTEQTRGILQRLKILYGRPEKTWILDFEYVSMPKRYSPIPLQLAIRQLDVFSQDLDWE
ncbi:hypothetical protein N7452_000739 [Penicillium brevicompactum]|uniref:Uncharacterized protein n=1 Tax=Penicillium brevicompactum TaxID=5074 RepID=A0A9W9R2M5_PENBR|nr:hypothetical protein N7452_000739 [Penicillium brevicompactum]